MDFTGYGLLASGGGKRLEQWGGRVILRPETAALWPWAHGKKLPDWDGIYLGNTVSGGCWEWRNPLPDPCVVSRGSLSFLVKPTASKHLGLFPEQCENWDWIHGKIAAAPHFPSRPKVLNLFGYTGGATLAAASAGGSVTHVDSSKAMVSWCADNARLTGLKDTPIRYIVEDAATFIRREIRRGNRYDAVIMDPPSFGRGKGGKLWKLSEHLPRLLEEALSVLSDHPLFILINTYSEEVDAEAGPLLEAATLGLSGNVESITLGLTGTMDGKFLPLGKAHRWTRSPDGA